MFRLEILHNYSRHHYLVYPIFSAPEIRVWLMNNPSNASPTQHCRILQVRCTCFLPKAMGMGSFCTSNRQGRHNGPESNQRTLYCLSGSWESSHVSTVVGTWLSFSDFTLVGFHRWERHPNDPVKWSTRTFRKSCWKRLTHPMFLSSV